MFSSCVSVLRGQTLTKKLDIHLWSYSCLCRVLLRAAVVTSQLLLPDSTNFVTLLLFFPNSIFYAKYSTKLLYITPFFFFFFLAQSHRTEINPQRHGDTMQAGKTLISSHLLLLIFWHLNRVNLLASVLILSVLCFSLYWPELCHFCTAFLS